ncbi:MAG: U32 family peptidase [Tidjanibacter sp.]|nr:U32 family peptidase [Tidjanibacter sp.]
MPTTDIHDFVAVELLSPARDLQCARAAIDAGADAVYMGARGLGARVAAGNSTADVAEAARYAHLYGARLYATLNTVLFKNELSEARTLAEELLAVGVDAFIIQDPAYLRMGLSGAEFHASTQMTNCSPEWVRFLEQSGFSRVVLERSLTLKQIRTIREATSVELEAFVHGAICVCRSGRCQMSRTLSGRSGNRGDCSQPCRLPYDLTDAEGKVIVGGKHLLSVRDLYLSHRVGDLLDAGVSSLKIEGRLKGVDYVRNITALYNNELNRQIAQRKGFVRSSRGRVELDFGPDAAKSFTRGGGEYFFDGVCRGVASFDTPKALGEPVGRVVSITGDEVKVPMRQQLHAGDGICFLSGGRLCGTNINSACSVGFVPNRADGIEVGVELFRNFDKEFSDRLLKSRTRRTIPINIKVRIDAERVEMHFGDIERVIDNIFPQATNIALAEQTLRAQLSKTGGTPFCVENFEVYAAAPMPFIPASELNRLRREALEELAERLSSARPSRRTAVEQLVARLPQTNLDGSWNVVNSLAEEFFRDHGAEQIEPGYDLRDDLTGVVVMETPYCLRREIGECLREGSRLGEPLFLQHGTHRYRLRFDCDKCEMKIIKI